MVKFKVKEGHPKMNVIYDGKKYNLTQLDELPDEVFKFAKKRKIYGISKVKEKKKEKKNVNSIST